MDVDILQKQIDIILSSNYSIDQKLQKLCNYLQKEVSHYDWVGFYFKNGNKNELKLAQYTGEATEHTIIPFGKGICGQVAVSNEPFIVQDVSKQSNYISCGWKVKSEIVLPIFVNKKNIGQIDIDSHEINAFSAKDRQVLGYLCEKLSMIL